METIFGSLVVAVPAGVPTLGPAVEPGPAMGGARDLVRAMGPDPELAQELEAVELVPGLDGVVVLDGAAAAARDSGRVVVLGRGAKRDRVVEAVRVWAPGPSLPQWAGGSLPRHY